MTDIEMFYIIGMVFFAQAIGRYKDGGYICIGIALLCGIIWFRGILI